MADSTSTPTAFSGTASVFPTSRAPHLEAGTKYASPPRDAWAISSDVSFMHADMTSFINENAGGDLEEASGVFSDRNGSGMDDAAFMGKVYSKRARNATVSKRFRRRYAFCKIVRDGYTSRDSFESEFPSGAAYAKTPPLPRAHMSFVHLHVHSHYSFLSGL